MKDYQKFASNSLKRIFGEDNVKKEWDVAKDSRDHFTRELYCPRLDCAVGPFNIDTNIDYNNIQIKNAADHYEDFINKLFCYSEQRDDDIAKFLNKRNKNPRCFLAIEIEKSGSSKHMLGNIANVSILGSIGVVVPFNESQLSLCKRIKEYLAFAITIKKVKEIFENVLVIDKENFLRVFNETE